MITYPNQIVVKINHNDNTNKTNPYMKNNIDSVHNAFLDLDTIGEVKLYFYFSKNKDNFDLALSSQDACEWCGLCRKTYTTAKNKLISKGYLRKVKGNIYAFYTAPNLIQEEQVKQEAQAFKEKIAQEKALEETAHEDVEEVSGEEVEEEQTSLEEPLEEISAETAPDTTSSVSLGEPIAEVIELEETAPGIDLPERFVIYYDDKEAHDAFAKLNKKYPKKYICHERYDENNIEYIEAILIA